jgi:hypothetical protein
MFNIKDNNSMPNNTIKGSYISHINQCDNNSSNNFYLPAIFNGIELEKQYIEDIKKMTMYIYDIELVNMKLLQNISFLNKICYFVNITHSNTTNFIMRNYKQLKHLLDYYVILYNKNLNKINLMKEKINNINLNLNMSYIENY